MRVNLAPVIDSMASARVNGVVRSFHAGIQTPTSGRRARRHTDRAVSSASPIKHGS